MTFDSPPERPREMPAHWMHLDIAGNVVRFVETQYHERAIADLARRVFPTHREMEVNGMPLRSIFVALAKKGRDV